jgi:hypothetical protein
VNREAYGVTIFCDDIRHEIAGKLTLVGCYLAEMNFNSPAPGFLPTFAALVNIRIPMSVEFKKLTLRIIKESDGEIEELFKADANISSEEKERSGASEKDGPSAPKLATITLPVKWSPMEFSKPGLIKVRGYLDDDSEIQAGALKVNFPPHETAPDGNA